MVNNEIVLLTVSTKENHEAIEQQLFLRQVQKLGYHEGRDFHIVGRGEPWLGFRTKMRLIRDFCADTDPERLVVFVDCFDVIVVDGPRQLEEKVSKLRRKASVILVGQEQRCMYNCHRLQTKSKRPRFVNTGFVAGRARDLKNMYDWCLKKMPRDDQVAIGMYRQTFPEKIVLDHNEDVVSNIYANSIILPKQFKGHKFMTRQKTSPSVIHMPFQDSDFGIRYNLFRKQLLFFPYNDPYSLVQRCRKLASHCMRVIRCDHGLQIQIRTIVLSMLFIIGLMLGLIYIF